MSRLEGITNTLALASMALALALLAMGPLP